MNKESSEDFEVFCQPCDQGDIRFPAYGYCTDCEEHLCESCFNTHKRPKPLRHHRLLDKDSMPKSLKRTVTKSHATAQSLTKPCLTHIQETIKFYCDDHEALLCSVCVTLEHPTSLCSVKYIPDISGQFVNSREYKDIIECMHSIAEQCEQITADLKQMIVKSNDSLSDVISEIKTSRRVINKRLDELQKIAEESANALKTENIAILKSSETTCEDITRVLKASSDSLKQLNTSKEADMLFIDMKSAMKVINENETLISQLEQTTSNVKEYHFKPNKAILTFVEKVGDMGTLTEIDIKWIHSHKGAINVKTAEDEEMCWITGMVLLNPSRLIITDNRNYAIKLVNIDRKIIISQLQLDTQLWDITSINKDQVAVTLPDQQLIKFVSMSSDKLIEEHKLKVDGDCYGLYCYQEKLIVSFQNCAKLEILDLKGSTLVSVAKFYDENIFNSPDYVKANSSSIYVSDSGEEEVIELNWNGEVVGRYQSFGYPQGLDFLENGSICVSDSKEERCNVQCISHDCREGEIVLKKNSFTLMQSVGVKQIVCCIFLQAVLMKVMPILFKSSNLTM
ncbi:uncharacterized protein LOC123565763 [Mercenaria mercenaria]|uniref:uncharacterized protein LOC123565763 n=1 Tax=Mercenaria mercenaria TaxID=6596 RepID=UPI00234FAB78|nr:uncharacterized protein LOC123565763 [Mercenaria mercenaria]